MVYVFQLAGVLAVLLGASMVDSAWAQTERREFRAYWVDAFGAGIFNEAEIDNWWQKPRPPI